MHTQHISIRTSIRTSTRTAAVLGVFLLASALSAAPAPAAVVETGSGTDTFTFSDDDFCGSGQYAESTVVVDYTYKLRTQGRDRLVYGVSGERVQQTVHFTDADMTFRAASVNNFKDLRVSDHGDGTYTILVKASGGSKLYGPDGKAIAHDPGQIRFELVLDDNGTPGVYDDDVEVSFTLVKESTGRNDDYCAAMINALG